MLHDCPPSCDGLGPGVKPGRRFTIIQGTNTPLLSSGVSAGPTNSDTTTQNSLVNAYAVQNLAVGGSNPSNNTTVKQKGLVNAYAGQNIALYNGAPGSNPSNTTTVKQAVVVDYANVGQHIQSMPLMPMSGP